MALVHFLFVPVLRRWHCVREDPCGYKNTKYHACNLNRLPVRAIFQKFLRAFECLSHSNLEWLTSSECWFFLKADVLPTAIAEKPCDVFEYRLNHNKVENCVSCLTFKSDFYDKVCQSNKAGKLRQVEANLRSGPIDSLWDSTFLN